MLKKVFALFLCLVFAAALAGCAAKPAEPSAPELIIEDTPAPAEQPAPAEPFEPALEDGVYTAEFDTDSSMFHVNETCEGKGTLVVQDGAMTIHLVMPSKNIVNLFPGLAEDAQKDGAELLEPTEESVTYSDGMTEEVFAFDLPVPVLDEEFDCALIGKKGTWYDHKVSVKNPEKLEELPDGVMTAEVTLAGGTGRATIQSPAVLTKAEDGSYLATIVWSSPHYEFMLVDGVQYDPVQEEGNSTFLIPVVMDEDMAVSAQTVAMSEPHLIDYTLHFDSSTIKGE